MENIQDVEAKVEKAVEEFDEKSKLKFNGACSSQPVNIPGLGNDPEKGFKNDCVWFSACV